MKTPSQMLGRELGHMSRRLSELEDNQGPVESNANLLLNNNEPVVLIEEELKIVKKFFEEDAFVVDHPVRGEVDSNFYKIDGGYNSSLDEVIVL